LTDRSASEDEAEDCHLSGAKSNSLSGEDCCELDSYFFSFRIRNFSYRDALRLPFYFFTGLDFEG
jgi:hypothetical protein